MTLLSRLRRRITGRRSSGRDRMYIILTGRDIFRLRLRSSDITEDREIFRLHRRLRDTDRTDRTDRRTGGKGEGYITR